MTPSSFDTPAASARLPPQVDVDLITQNAGIDNHDTNIEANIAAINEDVDNDAKIEACEDLR
jgi:hypothetical protein